MSGRHYAYGPGVPVTESARQAWPLAQPVSTSPRARPSTPAVGSIGMSSPGDTAGRRGEDFESGGVYEWWRHRLMRPAGGFPLDRCWSASGWPLLADDLWRVVHSDRSGARRADAHAVGLGLAAALVLELLVAGQIVLDDAGRVRVVRGLDRALCSHTAARRAGPEVAQREAVLPDRCADQLAALMLMEPIPLPVRTWLAALAPTAAEMTAERLLEAGHLVRRRRLFGQASLVPVDMSVAAWPGVRLLGPLQGREYDQLDVVLLGLCRALRLTGRLFDHQPGDQVKALLRLPDLLLDPLPHVWSQLDAAVNASVTRLR